MIPKYRVWDTRYKKIYTNVLSVDFVEGVVDVAIKIDSTGKPGILELNLDDIIFLQSTGIRDIYENDIVRDTTNTLYVVKYYAPRFVLEPIRKWHDDFGNWDDIVDVVGNIYENPELLEEE